MSAPAERAAVPGSYRPALRAGVLVGGPLYDGPATVHLVKDTGTGHAFKVGPREAFLLARMDGTRALDDLGTEYAAAHGKRLGEAQWRQLLALLGTRGLLDGAPRPAAAEAAASTAAGPRTLWRGTLRLVADADATTARLHRVLRPLLHPAALVPLLLLVLALQAALVVRAGEALDATWALFRNPVLLVAAATLLWLSTALHELAHGVVARHYGGTVAEIGLRWRLPVVIMYCTVDNYPYLPTRWARIATAVAGAVMNLLFLLPFGALWLLAPPDDATRDACAALVLLGTVQALAMLIPLPPLDGYQIAGQLTRTLGLFTASRTYLGLALRRDAAARAYPAPACRAYVAYPAAVLLVLAGIGLALWAAARHLLTGS
ncbi:metalloprotease [Streptomyces albidoflavus]|uniref:metalloprotease n=1 Tax=Streptomyces albidoflavus TaxID=1886 RepID=UPI00352D5F99|nr:M50 family metallopeptidase [Streptomyces albidoflavus]